MVFSKIVTNQAPDKARATQRTGQRANERTGGEHAPRILFYSHDTFGLGHLRRCRAIAEALTALDDKLSALIITGSTVAGRFTFPERVDYVRLPGVTKRSDGTYISDKLGFDIDEITDVRCSLITALAKQFVPDILIVDKEPTGFRGELLPALEWLHANGQSQLVLGLRDILDSPELLIEEWERKGAKQAIEKYYDDIWVYGLQSIYDPTQGLNLPESVLTRMHWTGYLRRESSHQAEIPNEPYILVTPGGGGDGKAMVDQVLAAYEKDTTLTPAALVVYGPFLTGDTRAEFERRVAQLKGRVKAVGFESHMESLMTHAQGVVAMGGYNTFCEILSFDIPAVIVPRTIPRLEQYIRASRAEELGLIRMLDKNRDGDSVDSMIEAIRSLPTQKPPSAGRYADLLGGLEYIASRTNELLYGEMEHRKV